MDFIEVISAQKCYLPVVHSINDVKFVTPHVPRSPWLKMRGQIGRKSTMLSVMIGCARDFSVCFSVLLAANGENRRCR